MSGTIEKTTAGIYTEPLKTALISFAPKTEKKQEVKSTFQEKNSLEVTALNDGTSEGSFELEIDESPAVTTVDRKILDEILAINTQPVVSKAELKNSLNSYVSLILQAASTDNPEQKRTILNRAKEVISEYTAQKAANPQLAKELNEAEKQIFKTDAKGNILTGEINSVEKLVNFYGISKEVGLVKSSQALLGKAGTIDSQIDNLKKNPTFENNLKVQKLEIEKALLYVQAKINLELANGAKSSDKPVAELTDTRTELRRSLTRAELVGELNRLQHGTDAGTVIKNIERIGSNWYVKDDKESFTQYRFTLAQAKTAAGKDNEALKLYESVKASNPEQAMSAQVSIISIHKQNGIFNEVPLLEAKLKTIEQKQEKYNQLKNDLNSGWHTTFTGNEKLRQEEAELSQLEHELKALGAPADIYKQINSIKGQQGKLLQDLENSYKTSYNALGSKLLQLQKAGKSNTEEYKGLNSALQNLEQQKHLTKASIYEKLGNNNQAIAAYQLLLGKAGANNELKNELNLKIAANFMVSKNYDKALSFAGQSKALSDKLGNSEHARALMLESSILQARGNENDLSKIKTNYNKIISSLENAKEPEADFLKGNARIELAKVFYAEGNFSQGDRLTGTVISQNKDLKNSALFTQGNAYLQNDQPVKAFAAFDQIMKESPTSPEAVIIKQTLAPFIINNRLEAGRADIKSDVWAAAQVALKASGSNSMMTSMALAAGGAAAGAAIGAGIGVWIGGAGAVPGALIGLAVGTAADRISALTNEWNKVEQTYKTGYENVSALENTVNLIGLGLDVIDVVPVAGALGKAGSTALKQSLKAGTKEISTDILEEVVSKTGNTSVKNLESQMASGMLKARELTRDIFENVDEMAKLFTDPKLVKTQVAVGGGLILTPGAIQSVNAINDFRNGKINQQELNKQLLNAGETTVKTAGSVILMGLVLGKVQSMGSKLDNMTKGMAKEMSGPASLVTPKLRIESPTPEAMKGYIIQTIKDMAVQKNSLYSTDAKLGVLKEIARAVESGKIAVKENAGLVTFAKIRNESGKITFEINPAKFDPAFVDQTYIAHELIHIAQPMKDMPDNLREGFTEYTSRALFPRKEAPELNYDKFVKATDLLLEGLVKRGSEKNILGKFLGEQYKNVTAKDIETKPQLKEEIKLKIAQTLMEWSETKFKDRLSSWFGLDIEDLSKTFDNLVKKSK